VRVSRWRGRRRGTGMVNLNSNCVKSDEGV
jgi:hypothetical protein